MACKSTHRRSRAPSKGGLTRPCWLAQTMASSASAWEEAMPSPSALLRSSTVSAAVLAAWACMEEVRLLVRFQPMASA